VRNIAQGEIGQSLAISKIEITKNSFEQIKKNFIKETDSIK
jgi:hypothetical protein